MFNYPRLFQLIDNTPQVLQMENQDRNPVLILSSSMKQKHLLSFQLDMCAHWCVLNDGYIKWLHVYNTPEVLRLTKTKDRLKE